MTTVVSPTASQQAAAEVLLADPGRWSPGRSKVTGQAFWLIKGSKDRSYFTTADGCTCPGFRHRGICSHSLAATMREAREAARCTPCERPVVEPLGARPTRYDVLFPAEG